MQEAAEQVELGQNLDEVDFSLVEDAVAAGAAINRFAGPHDSLIYRVNLAASTTEEDWIAPSSELCLQTGCAGNPIVAVVVKGGTCARSCGIVWIDQRGDGDPAVQFTQGTCSEVLSEGLKEAIASRRTKELTECAIQALSGEGGKSFIEEVRRR